MSRIVSALLPRICRVVLAIVLLVISGIPLAAQKPRRTELWLDSRPADSVSCGGLTVQFARFFRDGDQVNLLSANKKGTNRRAIDTWVWNGSDSVRLYDPHMFAGLDQDGKQITFWTSDEIGTFMAGRGFLLDAENERQRGARRELREGERREIVARQEYASVRLLPGASGGRRILVPDNDKNLENGIVLFCGEQKLGLLHRPKR